MYSNYSIQYFIQHCFICRPSDSTVPEDTGIEPRTVRTSALIVRRSNHSARCHPHSARSHPRSAGSHPPSRLDLIHARLDLIHTRLDLIHYPVFTCAGLVIFSFSSLWSRPPRGKIRGPGGESCRALCCTGSPLPPRNREGPSCGCYIWTNNSFSSTFTVLSF